ncbi:hypothetical protein [Microseira wollei]|uniref:hypothetical protein n=1 Tax=Microseira wollei TaxID=467598 RepID=UPI001CFE6C96|nr:hypothetical protein [Microseira wollei]
MINISFTVTMLHLPCPYPKRFVEAGHPKYFVYCHNLKRAVPLLRLTKAGKLET